MVASEQGSVWNRAAQAWEEQYEAQRAPLFDEILDACGVASGTRLLDAGCGSGGLSLRAARRGAHVAGFDISEQMVARAHAKVPDGDFRVGELNAPPFEDDAFDVAIACECLFLSPDPLGAIRQLGRVCAVAGRIGIAVFGVPEISDESRMFAAIQAVLPEPPKISLLSLSVDGVLEGLFAAAGLATPEARTLRRPIRFDSFDGYWDMVRNFAGIRSMIDLVGEDAVRAAALDGVRPSIEGTGALRLNNGYRLVVARRG